MREIQLSAFTMLQESMGKLNSEEIKVLREWDSHLSGFTDDEIASAYEGSLSEARVKLHVAMQSLWKEIKKAFKTSATYRFSENGKFCWKRIEPDHSKTYVYPMWPVVLAFVAGALIF